MFETVETVETVEASCDEDEKSLERLPIYGLKMCSSACLQNEVSCDFKECKHWINFEGDNNCDLIAIDKHRTNDTESYS